MLIRLLVVLFLLVVPFSTRSATVILTSFPESFYSHVAKEFKASYPDSSLQFMNKKTPALIAHIMQQRQPTPDLVWISSSDAMSLMEKMGYIETPVTFAWSRFGFFWHNDMLARHSLDQPSQWSSLLAPEYSGKVALSAPSRSGTNHLVIELILQQYGWVQGWQLIAELSGNLSTITARSFGVRQGIIKQRFAVAPVVDFFYKDAFESGYDVGFSPLPNTPLIPAQIANVSGTSTHDGTKFIEFLLSKTGQELLSSPQLNRIPLEQGNAIQLSQQAYRFDAQLSASRYHIVNRMFDLFVTERLADWQIFWMLWHKNNLSQLSHDQRIELNQIRSKVLEIPIDESVAVDPVLNSKLSPVNRYEHFYKRVTASWQSDLAAALSEAIGKLELLALQVEQGVSE